MRQIAVVFVVIILGAGSGVGLGYWRFNRIAAPDLSNRASSDSEGARLPQPIAEVSHLEHDFGTLSLAATGEHRFTVRNVGTAPLRLQAGETSCKCTVSRIEHPEIPPGGATDVLVRWKGLDEPGPYRQTAVILTNDPGRPRIILSLVGKMIVAVQLKPAELVFSQIASTQRTIGQVRLYSYQKPEISISRWQNVGNGAAGQVECRWEPLSAAMLEEEPDALAGQLIEVTIKPGLPSGPFEQTIRLTTDDPLAPSLDLPIRGYVVSDISVAGPGWDSQLNLLDLGTIDKRKGLRRNIVLVARGPFREEVRFELAEVRPAFLRCEIGAPRAVNNGATYQTPITIEVPKESPAVSFAGPQTNALGRMVFRTNHPDVPEIKILLSLTIEE